MIGYRYEPFVLLEQRCRGARVSMCLSTSILRRQPGYIGLTLAGVCIDHGPLLRIEQGVGHDPSRLFRGLAVKNISDLGK